MSSETRDKLLAELARKEALVENLERQCNEARSQIALLRHQAAAEQGPPAEAPVPGATREPRDTPLKNSEKLRLFRQLFRDREDVFPLYWENPKRGKSGILGAASGLLFEGLGPWSGLLYALSGHGDPREARRTANLGGRLRCSL
jgi:hypothetical protein